MNLTCYLLLILLTMANSLNTMFLILTPSPPNSTVSLFVFYLLYVIFEKPSLLISHLTTIFLTSCLTFTHSTFDPHHDKLSIADQAPTMEK